MITLGYIKKLNEPGSNLVSVRLPVFEQAGINEEALFSANIGHEPGSVNGYSVGDCVVVGFLNNTLDSPIILGKLYTGNESPATNFSNANSLTVTESATLPANTTIGGMSFLDMATKLNAFKDVKDGVDSLVNESSGKDEIASNQYGIQMYIRQLYGSVGGLHMLLYLKLHGFTYDDVGKKIYLFRTTRNVRTSNNNRSRGYKHPADRAVYICEDNQHIMPMGYGVLANTDGYPDVPTWMGKPYIRTEWEIDEGTIKEGGIVIDMSSEWLPLLSYSKPFGTWCQVIGSSRYGSYHMGCMRMRFGVVDANSTTDKFRLLTMTPESLCFGISHHSTYDAYVSYSNGTTLRTDSMHVKIE